MFCIARAFSGRACQLGQAHCLVRSLSPWRDEAWHTRVYLCGTPSQFSLESEEGCLRVPRDSVGQGGSRQQSPGASEESDQPRALAWEGDFL